MKRIVVLLLCLILLTGSVLQTGCAGARGGGSEVCARFLAYLTEGSYGAAFDLVSDSLKNTTGEPTEGDAAMISYQEFVDKYTQIYDALGLEGITYEITSAVDASITATVGYTMIYHTEKMGDLTNEYSMSARYENRRWGVQWSPALIFPEMQWGDKLLLGVNYPKRGEIFDAEGELLVKNIDPVAVFCVPSSIKDPEQFKTDVLAIKELQPRGSLDQDWYGIVDNASKSKNSSVVITRLHPDLLDEQLETRILAVEGLGIDRSGSLTSMRYRAYPYGRSASHVLGFASIIWKDDLKKFKEEGSEIYDGDSWLGYSGLENQFESTLRGVKGSYAYIQGADGTNRKTLYNIPAVDGQDLHLTIDINLQKRVETVVDTLVYDKNVTGTVLMMNPKTGAVTAMYSFPDYDAESFSRGTVGSERWEQLEKDPQTPMLNRAIQGLYAPGSTFKPLTGFAALETGTLTLDDVFPETDLIKVGAARSASGNLKDTWRVYMGQFAYTGVREVNRTNSSGRHTPMNMSSSIIDSDNIYFSWAAMKMGWDKFKSFMAHIGFGDGELLPFDLATRASQIKDPEKNSNETWDLLAMSGYGQGEILVTPLQMATYIGGVRNGGVALEPYIVESIWQAEGTEYNKVSSHEVTEWKTLCSRTNAAAMEEMMQGVCANVKGGTGRWLGVRSYVIAGKTGTAEIGLGKEKDKELAWFIGFRSQNKDGTEVAPENERLVLVMLELDNKNLPEESAMMKFKIAQALLKDDKLTEPVESETCIIGG